MANAAPASAAKCLYAAQSETGSFGGITGIGRAGHISTACVRARRECNRKLERAFRNGRAGRGARCYQQGM
jgi:hypothetical protein